MGEPLRIGRALLIKPKVALVRVMFYDRNSGLIGSARGPLDQTVKYSKP